MDFLNKSSKLHRECLITYVRLLEDEESELRKLAAHRISVILGIPPLNEEIMLTEVLHRTLSHNKDDEVYLKSMLKSFMGQNSDYMIRLKNSQEERIFAYDKPNKYRADINTLVLFVMELSDPKKILTQLKDEVQC